MHKGALRDIKERIHVLLLQKNTLVAWMVWVVVIMVDGSELVDFPVVLILGTTVGEAEVNNCCCRTEKKFSCTMSKTF